MTIEYTMILKYQLLFLAINKLLVNGEWVEMPQFSDNSKVYKLSVHDPNSFYNKFSNNEHQTVPGYDVKSVNQLLQEFANTDKNNSGGFSAQETESSVHLLETATINPFDLPEESLDENTDDDNDDSVDILTANPDLKEFIPIEAEASTPAISSTLELPTEEPSVSSTTISILPELKSEASPSMREKHNNETIQGMGFQDYLPMEMLKKVHRTLKSQPSTLEGKIRFLKQFEKDLTAEIEARLSTALTPPRRTRGTHDYYDHDEEMGFPSLEGALMAISFLTFAVYLVRLVMLLFRNTNNTQNAATIFFGRNRRSTDTLNNKTQEILNYLNTFDMN